MRVPGIPADGGPRGPASRLLGWARELVVLPIRFYRRFLSPLKPPTCRFHPTCSAYAIGAVRTHGIAKGLLLAVWRVLRCQPFARGGLDPVPEPGRWPRRVPAPGSGSGDGGRVP